MSEPKIISMPINEAGDTVDVFRADDPAEILKGRKADAMDKRAGLSDIHTIISIVHLDNGQFQVSGNTKMEQTLESRAPSLLAAIESVKEGE